VEFVTNTERSLARLLDALGIRWEYEPRLFSLETDAEGKTKSGFRPDFYLPEMDLYVEVTTQRTLTAKNRKIRRMTELYPNVRVVLLGRTELSLFTET
jgi:hypothetical protein